MSDKVPVVFITLEAKQKLDLYLELGDEEISGLGRVKKLNNCFLIHDIMLFAQECSASSTELDSKALDEFLLTEIENGREVEDCKLWWHSHVNMGTFWSGTDDDTIEKFRNGWCLSIVGNKSLAYRTRIDLFEPFRYTFDNVRLETILPASDDLKTLIEAEIKEKVKVKTWSGGGYNSPYFKGYGYDEDDNYTSYVSVWDSKTGKWEKKPLNRNFEGYGGSY